MGLRIRQLLGAYGAIAMLAAPAAASRPHMIGGTPAAPGAWPSAAFIQDTTSAGTSSCSGTVIAPNVVLTAAHCVVNENTSTIEPSSGFLRLSRLA
jgi:secreted trypsin-like serine protease